MTPKITLPQLNGMDMASFVQELGAIFEHSPWVAERVLNQRPFASMQSLHTAMVAAIEAEGSEAQLKLIRAHPELAGQAAVRGELTEESSREQSGAGLDRCTPEEFAELQSLNTRYNEKFGFPFIVAVRGHTRHSIMALMAQRLGHNLNEELHECLQQIYKIGEFRLTDLFKTEQSKA
jgi:2-oxo-4-hydroxy-4-carboxy-5-ureidoimidazoline decarboxylase